ncbi:MAG: glycosyltransferase family 4 protein [Patescibacteria group bacterium]|nr:glycosyltransferase family 4 protein [Patescibacteria group bacterium]
MLKKKLSIIYVIGDSSLTGAPRHLLALTDNIDQKEFSISVILPQGPLADKLQAKNIKTFLVPMRYRSDVPAVNAMKKLLKKYDPDILHAHGSRGGLLARLAVRNLPIKVVYTEHLLTKNFRLDNPLLYWTHIRSMRVLDRWTDITIAVSKAVGEFLVQSKITKPDKVKVIYNGVDLVPDKVSEDQLDNLRKQYKIDKEEIVIGTVGSLNLQKDTSCLIKALPKIFTKLPNAKLLIVGSGPLQHRLQKLSKKLKIEKKVIFTGSIENVSPLLKLMNIFVLPSRSEAFGLSVLEAMRMGIPVVATKVGGLSEVIVNNRNGIFVPAGDPKKLTSAIMKILNDRKLIKKLISGGWDTLPKFAMSKMVNETEKLYKSLFKK